MKYRHEEQYGRLAQLARATRLHRVGRGFESLNAHNGIQKHLCIYAEVFLYRKQTALLSCHWGRRKHVLRFSLSKTAEPGQEVLNERSEFRNLTPHVHVLRDSKRASNIEGGTTTMRAPGLRRLVDCKRSETIYLAEVAESPNIC